jgi:hypothetical protein
MTSPAFAFKAFCLADALNPEPQQLFAEALRPLAAAFIDWPQKPVYPERLQRRRTPAYYLYPAGAFRTNPSYFG